MLNAETAARYQLHRERPQANSDGPGGLSWVAYTSPCMDATRSVAPRSGAVPNQRTRRSRIVGYREVSHT